MELREELFFYQDLAYKNFHKKLVPDINEENIIGVRVPVMRKIAKRAFRENLSNPCEYYEERMIKGFTLAMKKCSTAEHIDDIASFIKYIDNWAICDSFASSLKFIKGDGAAYYPFAVSLMNGEEYSTRLAIVILMNYYMTDDYIDSVLSVLSDIDSDFYYVNMAVAWAFSVAYVHYPARVEQLLASVKLKPWVQNKTIQKIRESYRVTPEAKSRLLSYKMQNR